MHVGDARKQNETRATLAKESIIRYGIIGCYCNDYVFQTRFRACSATYNAGLV